MTSPQSTEGLDKRVPARGRPLPFAYESTGMATQFTNGLDPDPRSREIFTFHRPEELLRLQTLVRYNGPNHEHAAIRYRPRIHRGTVTAITAGRKPGSDAQATTRGETLEGVLACLIEVSCLSNLGAEPDHPSLFHGDSA